MQTESGQTLPIDRSHPHHGLSWASSSGELVWGQTAWLRALKGRFSWLPKSSALPTSQRFGTLDVATCTKPSTPRLRLHKLR